MPGTKRVAHVVRKFRSCGAAWNTPRVHFGVLSEVPLTNRHGTFAAGSMHFCTWLSAAYRCRRDLRCMKWANSAGKANTANIRAHIPIAGYTLNVATARLSVVQTSANR